MEGDWKTKLMKDLWFPFAIIDQVGMNLMDKPTVYTIIDNLEQQVAELETTVKKFEHVVSAIPKGDPIALAEVQLQIHGPLFSFS